MSDLISRYMTETWSHNGELADVRFTAGNNFNFAYDVVDERAVSDPDLDAMIYLDRNNVSRRITFAQMKDLSDRAAFHLMSKGISRGDRVMLMLKRRYSFWFILMALHKLGAVAVPTSHMVTAEDINERVKKAGIKMIIAASDRDVLETLKGVKGADIYLGDGAFTGLGPENNSFDHRNDVENSEFRWLFEDYDGAGKLEKRQDTSITDNMLMYFTSGTSGEPKAVMHNYAYPLAHIVTARYWHGCEKGRVHLAMADSGWAKTAWGKLYGQWFAGATVMVYDYDTFYAREILEVIENFRVATFCAPPTVYKYLVREDMSGYDLSSLKQAVSAGEKLPGVTAEVFFKYTGIRIREGFGQTETALLTGNYIYTVKGHGLGKASPLYNLDVVDAEGRSVPDGCEGELVIRPDPHPQAGMKSIHGIPVGVFDGYFDNQDLYDEVWEGGIYHTRDKVIRDKDGCFTYVSRADDVIKSAGYRIGPSEVEEILMRQGDVQECAVTGYPSKNRGQLVKASIVLNPGAADALRADPAYARELEDRIRSYAIKEMASYKIPRMFCFVDSLPKTVNGKINRNAIRTEDYRRFRSRG